MELNDIDTINDFMKAVGEALSEGDGNALMALQDISDGWIQTDIEHESQQALLTGALNSIGW